MHLFALASLGFASLPAGSPPVTCDVVSRGGTPVPVSVQVLRGAIMPDDSKFITYEGQRVAVSFQMGDDYEPQRLLSLSLGDKTLNVYDPAVDAYVTLTREGRIALRCQVQSGGSERPNIEAETLRCAADQQGGDRVQLPVTIDAGAMVSDPEVVSFHGRQISASFNRGDSSEPQQFLQMTDDAYSAAVFRPGQSLYALVGHADGTRVQCW